MEIPRCKICNTGIYLSRDGKCSGCGTALVTLILTKKVTKNAFLGWYKTPVITKFDRIKNAILDSVVSFANPKFPSM